MVKHHLNRLMQALILLLFVKTVQYYSLPLSASPSLFSSPIPPPCFPTSQPSYWWRSYSDGSLVILCFQWTKVHSLCCWPAQEEGEKRTICYLYCPSRKASYNSVHKVYSSVILNHATYMMIRSLSYYGWGVLNCNLFMYMYVLMLIAAELCLIPTGSSVYICVGSSLTILDRHRSVYPIIHNYTIDTGF